jgi:hypothetical protein
MSNRNGSKPSSPKQADLDNRSRQLNPSDPVYWSSRGLPQPEQPTRSEGNVGDDFEQFGPLGSND